MAFYVFKIVVYVSFSLVLINVLTTDYASARDPYMRVYGNDVVAGGGYGSGCSPDPDTSDTNYIDIIAYGDYLGASTHATYVGAGSELASFAPGTINQFLPGSTYTARTQLYDLSYANDDITKKSPGVSGGSDFLFGGGFIGAPSTSVFCVDPFPSSFTSNISGHPINDIDVSTLCGGVYNHNNVVPLRLTGVLPNFCRVTIVSTNPARADVIIAGNITTQNIDWPSIDAIPLLRVHTDGNIYIHKNVTEITGIFQAGGDPSKQGSIFTCSDLGVEIIVSPLADNGVDEIATDCRQPLTVFGSLTAREISWYRINGEVSSAVPGESRLSSNIAEKIIFSPEVYLALLTEQGPPIIDVGRIDAVRTLPPAF